jgi:hypothetical protein
MDIENLANMVAYNKAVLNEAEEALYSEDSLKELCRRLQLVCIYIVALRHDSVKDPDGFFIQRTIMNMTISQIIDKKYPINNIIWSVDDRYITAEITTIHDAVYIYFPINEEKFYIFIKEHQKCLEKKLRKERAFLENQEVGEKQYAKFIQDHIDALKIKELNNKLKTDEQYIKDKTATLQQINLFKSKYPDMMKDLIDSISVD